MKKTFSTFAILLVLAVPAWAAPKTITLSVPTMNCSACPITVKKALSKVPSVTKADVNFDRREATVTFDDVKTSLDALTKATEEAGYPSTLAGSSK